ncbi:MAG TPA: retropepsin-like aspartic protease [Methylomirabilota bacterium]
MRLDNPMAEGDRVAIGARTGEEGWRQPFRIVCGGARRPQRLEMLAGRDAPVLEMDDFGPGVFCDMPRRLRWRRGWLTDTVEITHVGAVTSRPSYALHDGRGGRAARVDPSAPSRARATRSPRGRLPLVRATMDGRDLGWCLIDTGAGASAIDRAVADDLGLASLGRTWVLTPTGGEGAAYRRGRALAIGPVTLPEALDSTG